MKLIVLPFV
jgi:hypothetical protein